MADDSTAAFTLDELRQKINRLVLMDDPQALDILLGVTKAQDLPCDPPWLMMVGPSSGSKTELLSLLSEHPDVYMLSDLTDKTFASGLSIPGRKDPSLLAELTNQILLLKDFTTVLSMHRDRRQAVLAQLREIYDGRYDKAWGTGKRLHWRGRLGFIAGVTEAIEKHHGVMATLGPRFTLLRLRQPNRRKVARRAMDNSRDERHQSLQTRADLAAYTGCLLICLPNDLPDITSDQLDTIGELADLVTRARSGVDRDGYKRELAFTPEPEMPARLARALLSLVQGVAVVRGHGKVRDEDIAAGVRVGFDSIPSVRSRVLRHLTTQKSGSAVPDIAANVEGFSETSVRRALEELDSLNLLAKKNQRFEIAANWRNTLKRFSEMSDPLRVREKRGKLC